jgi:hypothetical protein
MSLARISTRTARTGNWSHILSWEILNKGIAPHVQGRPSDKDHAGIAEMMNHSQNGRIKARQGTRFSNVNDATHTAAQNASTDTSLDKEITAACHGGGVLSKDAAARAHRQFNFVCNFLEHNPGKVAERWVRAFINVYCGLKDQDGKPLLGFKAVTQALKRVQIYLVPVRPSYSARLALFARPLLRPRLSLRLRLGCRRRLRIRRLPHLTNTGVGAGR